MGLFDAFKKKDCEICGKEVGLLGYKKLEDGEICKDCVKLLSPWFDDRRHSTVAQIKEQLAYREENKKNLATFRPAKTFGERIGVAFRDSWSDFAEGCKNFTIWLIYALPTLLTVGVVAAVLIGAILLLVKKANRPPRA